LDGDLRTLVRQRLDAHGLSKTNWSGLVLSACDGRDALDAALAGTRSAASVAGTKSSQQHIGTCQSSVKVEGFRGVGPPQTITFTPGPGLTIVVGCNGSGKSSFAEALEVVFTGDSSDERTSVNVP
jgi:hypothetical protein